MDAIVMDEKSRNKVIGHALDHVAYGWSKCLPVRHDRREWTKEEIELYDQTYDNAIKKRKQNAPE